MINAELQDLKLELWLRQRNSGELVWVTKDKQSIPIKDMTDQHLVNAIKRAESIEEYSDAFFDYKHEDAGDRI